MSRAVFCCNFPVTASMEDAVTLLRPFGEIERVQIVKEEDAHPLLPGRRRRPTLPEKPKNSANPTSGSVAIVEFEHAADAQLASEDMDGAVYFGHELVTGLIRTR